jgi:excisionase family DNA binding protein
MRVNVPAMAGNAELISIAQAAELLGVSRDTVRRLIAVGELSSMKIGVAVRIPREDVDHLVARGRARTRGV